MLGFIIAMSIIALFSIIYIAVNKKESLTITVIGVVIAVFFAYAAITPESYLMLIISAGVLIWCLAGVVSDVYNKIQKNKGDKNKK